MTEGGGARLRRTIGTLFGIGYAPASPGTAASVLTFAGVLVLPAAGYGRTMLVTVLVTSLLCVIVGHRAEVDFGRKDPSSFVLDEVAGYAISVLRCAKPGILELIAALILFRVFDIWKPFPIRQAEALPGGWGILVDDLLAGGYTAGLLLALHYVLPAPTVT